MFARIANAVDSGESCCIIAAHDKKVRILKRMAVALDRPYSQKEDIADIYVCSDNALSRVNCKKADASIKGYKSNENHNN